MMSNGPQNGHAGQAHLNEEWIEKYQSKSLAAEELQAAGRHLSDCGTCRRVLLARMGPVRLPPELAEMPEALHLSYEQITAYIDGKLSSAENERVEAHTFICSSCSREIADLRKLEERLAEPVTEVKPEPSRISFWERIAQPFRVPGALPRFGLALGAIALGIFLLIPDRNMRVARSPLEDAAEAVRGSVHAGLNLGGLALVIGGVVYIVYRLSRRRK